MTKDRIALVKERFNLDSDTPTHVDVYINERGVPQLDIGYPSIYSDIPNNTVCDNGFEIHRYDGDHRIHSIVLCGIAYNSNNFYECFKDFNNALIKLEALVIVNNIGAVEESRNLIKKLSAYNYIISVALHRPKKDGMKSSK